MDVSMIFAGVIIFASVAAPVIYLSRAKTNADKKLVKAIQEFAHAHGNVLGRYEICQSTVLGIDEGKRTLFYIKQKKGEVLKMAINLADVERCAIAEVKNNGHSIERLEWVLVNKNPEKTDIVLEFYNAATTNFSIGEELDIVKRWQDIVTEAIKKAA